MPLRFLRKLASNSKGWLPLRAIATDHVLGSLQALQSNCILKIKTLRNELEIEKNSNKFGRQAAFLSQQYINAKLVFEYLEQSTEKAPPTRISLPP